MRAPGLATIRTAPPPRPTAPACALIPDPSPEREKGAPLRRRAIPSARDRALHCFQRGFDMPPGFRLLLVVVLFGRDGALSRFGDGAVAVGLHQLPRIFVDRDLVHKSPPRQRPCFERGELSTGCWRECVAAKG